MTTFGDIRKLLKGSTTMPTHTLMGGGHTHSHDGGCCGHDNAQEHVHKDGDCCDGHHHDHDHKK